MMQASFALGTDLLVMEQKRPLAVAFPLLLLLPPSLLLLPLLRPSLNGF